jgi:Transglycosylase-like domain
MRTRRTALVAIGLAAIAAPAVALAQPNQIFTTNEQRPFGLTPYELAYEKARDHVADALGNKGQLGRDIVVDGIVERDGDIREPTQSEVAAATKRLNGRLDQLRQQRELAQSIKGMPAPFSGYATRATVQCESGGDYTTDTGNGYYGGYQFDQQTWDAWAPDKYVGTNPADAPPIVQDVTAAAVPSDAWPNC